MRAVHVDFGKEWRGGQRQCLLLHQGLLNRGIESVLICNSAGELLKKGADYTIGFRFNGETSPLGALRLAKLIKKLKADIVHSHDAHSLTPLLIIKALGAGFNLVHTRRVDFPIKTLMKYNNRHVNLVAISQGVKDILLKCGVNKEIPIVYSGTPVPAFPDRAVIDAEKASLGIPGDHIVFCSTANFAPHKDFPTMLKAFKEYLSYGKKAKLLLVGGGGGFADTVRLAEDLGISENVIFTGFKEDVPKYLKCADIYIVTSSAEGLNTSIIDAMHAALPVIASKVGGIPELVRDGENGCLVEAGNHKSFANAMCGFSENLELYTAFSKASVKIAANFTDQAMTEGYIDVYSKLYSRA
jgi:glycosyltransferase involved in cell wall biosynthesis